MDFFKYEATGNDFILIDMLGGGNPEELSTWVDYFQETAHRICDRHFGIGADGILLLTPSRNAYAFMHIINADGSTAEMCGNGIRCAAAYLYKHRVFDSTEPLKIDTPAGIQTVKCACESENSCLIDVTLAAGSVVAKNALSCQNLTLEGTIVDTGNSHIVFEVDDPRQMLDNFGQTLSNHPAFPDRINVEFISEIARSVLNFTVYERGVGPTLSCGTGAVAAAIAYAHNHHIPRAIIEIHAPGGTLYVLLKTEQPHLQGPANFIFSGKLDVAIFDTPA